MNKIAILFLLMTSLLSSCRSTPTPKNDPIALTNYPPGWSLENSPGQTDGMFAYVSLRNRNSDYLQRYQEECAKIGSELVVNGDISLFSDGDGYWLYRNKANTVVFIREYDLKAVTNKCSFRILEKRTVKIQRTNSQWPFPFSKGRVKWNDRYSTSNRAIKGIQALCRNVNIFGLSGYGECYSVNKDLTKGMMLKTFEWTDELMNPEFNGELDIEIVIPHALIDANIFTQSEAWAHKAN